jgi:hypothetical protein
VSEDACRRTGRQGGRLHDLLAVFARELAGRHDSARQRHEALERALGGWLALAEDAAGRAPNRTVFRVAGPAPRWGGAPLVDAVVDDPLDWLERERAALVAAVKQAASAIPAPAWDLTNAISGFLHLRHHLTDWQQSAEATTRPRCCTCGPRSRRSAPWVSSCGGPGP